MATVDPLTLLSITDTEPYYVRFSLGLWWVRVGDVNPALYVSTDRRDALEQSGAYENPRAQIINA